MMAVDTPSKKLNERLGDTLATGEMTDILFKFDKMTISRDGDEADVTSTTSGPSPSQPSTISAHKMILACGSSVFKAMFFGPLAEKNDVNIDDVSPNAFKKMLEYLYTDITSVTHDDVTEVLYVAKKYDVPGLVQLCVQKIEENLTRESAVSIYPQAMMFNELGLAEKCLDVLDKNAHYVINTNAIVKEIDRDLFKQILKRDTFCAREVDIWDALIWWAKQKLPTETSNRPEVVREYLGDLLFLIRFSQMTPKELVQIILPTRMLEGDEVMEALHYAFPKKKRGEHKGMFPVGMRTLNQELVVKARDIPNDSELLGSKFRMERVVDRGFRSVRFRVDNRIFLKRITLSNVPHRVTIDKYVVAVKVLDCALNEIVQSFEYNLTRQQGYPPTPAAYKLDLDPIELCPKITYEISIAVEPANPETKIVKTRNDTGGHATVRFQYFGRIYPDDVVVDELHFST